MQTKLRHLVPVLLFASFILVACDSPEEKEARYVKRGNALFEEGKFEKARLEYKNAARIKATDPELGYRIGLIDEAQGDFRGAFAGFTNAEQQDAHYIPALIKLAQYYLAGEQFDQVKKRIDTILADQPENADGHALLAALHLREKDYPATEKEARFALEKQPGNLIAYSVLTGMYSAQGERDKAITIVNEGIVANPKSMPLLLLKTEIFERANDIPRIAECYEAIFKLAPNEPRYRVNLAAIYLNAGQIDKAEETLRAGVAALPDNWDMKHQLINFVGDHRTPEAAEKEIRDLIQANPDRSELYNWLVDFYMSNNQTEKAITFLNDVIAKNNVNKQGLDARTALARIKYIRGDKDGADALAKEVLEKDQNDLDALFVKARIEADNGAYQNAVVDLRSIIRDQPKAKEAMRLLSEVLLLQGHVDLAIETLNQMIEQDPLNFAAKVRLAQMYHLNHDSKHAMSLLFIITKADPTYPVAWEATARVAIDTKDWATAEQAIRTLGALDGQQATAQYLRGQMLAHTGDTDGALKAYKAVIEADPSTPIAERALVALVGAYKNMGQLDQATKYIEELKSPAASVNTILAETYLASGKHEKAAIGLEQAMAGTGPRQDPFLDRARMYIFEKKPEEALDVLLKGAEVAPSDPRALLMRAQILGENGRTKEAIDTYEQLLARNPDLDAAANNLAQIIADYNFNDQAALDRAQHIAERFVASANPYLLDTLAWVYYRQGKFEQAQNIMQRVFAPGTDMPPQVHYHYAAILLKSASGKDQAKSHLQQATIKGATYPGIDDANKLLSGL